VGTRQDIEVQPPIYALLNQSVMNGEVSLK